MSYHRHVVNAIHIVLLQGPLKIKELAGRIGYSYSYTNEHLMYIRRDPSLSWDVSFLGHGNTGNVFLVPRGAKLSTSEEQAMVAGHNSWLRTSENKCISLQKQCDLAASLVISPAAKTMIQKAMLYIDMAEDLLEKAAL